VAAASSDIVMFVGMRIILLFIDLDVQRALNMLTPCRLCCQMRPMFGLPLCRRGPDRSARSLLMEIYPLSNLDHFTAVRPALNLSNSVHSKEDACFSPHLGTFFV
jgi:hypothetical protein